MFADYPVIRSIGFNSKEIVLLQRVVKLNGKHENSDLDDAAYGFDDGLTLMQMKLREALEPSRNVLKPSK